MTNHPAAGSVARNQYGTFTVHAPSAAQIKFVERLVRQKGTTGDADGSFYDDYLAGRMNKKQASAYIDHLLGLPDAPKDAGVVRGYRPRDLKRPASDKQVALIRGLVTERIYAEPGTTDADASDAVRWIDAVLGGESVESWEASKAIDHLIASPRAAARVEVELEAGMYRTPGGVIYKVYRAVHGSGRMCAKELVVTRECPGHESTDGPVGNVIYCDGSCGNGEATAHFEYRGLATRFTQADHRMTLEQAKEFGAIYGVCCQCGATLTDERSIEAGIGPICAGKI